MRSADNVLSAERERARAKALEMEDQVFEDEEDLFGEEEEEAPNPERKQQI